MKQNADIRYHGPVIVFDLDDTLYKERDFAFSGYAAIETHSRIPGVAERMREAFLKGKNPMDAALEMRDGLPFELSDFLNIYRYHKPDITLPESHRRILDSLSAKGIRMYIVTDGRSITQRNKIKALGLDRYFPPERVFISEETGEEKRAGGSFRTIVRELPEAREFFYVGDNPGKDFEAPNMLGWTTVMLRDKDKVNIHPQTGDFPPLSLPAATIDSLSELLNLIH